MLDRSLVSKNCLIWRKKHKLQKTRNFQKDLDRARKGFMQAFLSDFSSSLKYNWLLKIYAYKII